MMLYNGHCFCQRMAGVLSDIYWWIWFSGYVTMERWSHLRKDTKGMKTGNWQYQQVSRGLRLNQLPLTFSLLMFVLLFLIINLKNYKRNPALARKALTFASFSVLNARLVLGEKKYLQHANWCRLIVEQQRTIVESKQNHSMSSTITDQKPGQCLNSINYINRQSKQSWCYRLGHAVCLQRKLCTKS